MQAARGPGMTAALVPNLAIPRNCTFAHDDWFILARHWYPIAFAREVGQRPVGTKLLDQPLVIYRADDELVVAPDICPHRGVPLSMGKQVPGGVECAYHGLRFGPGGQCTHVPAHPSRDIPARMHLVPFPHIERYGLIWTCLDRSVECPEPGMIIDMPHWGEAGYQCVVCPSVDIHAFAGRQVEGFLDVAHFAFVHKETFGDPDISEVPPYSPVRTENGFEAEYWSSVSNYPVEDHRRAMPTFQWLRHFRCHLPFSATIEIHFPNDGRFVVMNAASPVSAKETRLFAPTCRNFDTDRPEDEIYEFTRRIFEEDKAIVEAQIPECLPLDPDLEAHIPADMSSLMYRRGLRALGLGEFFYC